MHLTHGEKLMSNYRKRGQAGYTGKKEAKSKVSRERNYAKEEIRQELKEMEEGDDFRYNAGGKKKNKIASLRYRIDLYAKRAKAARESNRHGIFGYSWYESSMTEMKEELDELEKGKDKNYQRKLRTINRLSQIKIKIENMSSCHVVSHPISNTEIEGKLVFDITDDGTVHGIDAASDFTGAFADVQKALLKEIDSWMDGMEEDDEELAQAVEAARKSNEIMNEILNKDK